MTAADAMLIAVRAAQRASELLERERARAIANGDEVEGKRPNPKYCQQCQTRGRCVDSRTAEEGGWRRRYLCPRCKIRWSSRELLHEYD